MKVELLIEIECDDYLCGECEGIANRLCEPFGLILERGDVTGQFERLDECTEAAVKAKGLRDRCVNLAAAKDIAVAGRLAAETKMVEARDRARLAERDLETRQLWADECERLRGENKRLRQRL